MQVKILNYIGDITQWDSHSPYYVQFRGDHRNICQMINATLYDKCGKYIYTLRDEKCNTCPINSFPGFDTKEKLIAFIKKLNTILNDENNKAKLQDSRTFTGRELVQEGHTIICRKSKITIASGHLSYKVCSC